MLEISDSNIFDHPGSAIGCTVNLVGAMGAGIAREVAGSFCGMLGLYRADLRTGRLNKTGDCSVHVGLLHQRTKRRFTVVCIPTKIHYKDPSPISLIEKSVKWLADNLVEEYGICTIYIPPLGCGNGKLDFDRDVLPILEKYFNDIDDLRVVVCFNRKVNDANDSRS